MRWLALAGATLAACSFDTTGGPIQGARDAATAAPDAPPASPDVHFVSVTASAGDVRPGQYGLGITAVLRNDLAEPINAAAVSLSITDGAGDVSSSFRWRSADRREAVTREPPTTIAAGTEVTYRFVIDSLPSSSAAGTLEINGTATFEVGGQVLSATPAASPASLTAVTPNPAIVVDAIQDESDDDADVCLREALALARSRPGLDRIVFDPAVFPPGSQTVSALEESLGALPAVDGTGGDLILDGSGAGFVLAMDSNWESPEGRYGLRLTSGNLAVSGIGFRDMGYNYRNEGDLSGNNCGASGAQLEGGAIRVDGGTLVLEGNEFADPNVSERNCFAASVRIHGGSGHRVVGNTWTDASMDSLYIDAAVVEVTGNLMNAGSDLDKVDECIYVEGQGGMDTWIVGNVCVDQEFSGVVADGSDAGTLHVVHNTFVRNGRQGLSGVRRTGGSRAVVLRNNLYVGNEPAAVQADSSGAGLDIAFEMVSQSPLCDTCASATVDSGSVVSAADPKLVNASGATRQDLAPAADSPAANSATVYLDRNGATPGFYSGSAPERGAVELPQ